MLGFVKSFGFREVKELTLPISKLMGIFWLMATIFFLVYGILYFMNSKYSWLFGLTAVVLSQILIIIFWEDAKFGTMPNVIILFVSIMSFNLFNFQKLIQQETDCILSNNQTIKHKNITEKDIQNLPEPVKKWISNSGIINKPFISFGKVIQKAEIKMKPEQNDWMTASAIQYTTVESPGFIWTVDVKMNSLLNFQGRDKFENGKGEMMIKMNSLFNVVNEKGEKLNEGTIQRFLGEMVWFPSLALSPYITWEQKDETTAKATINYKGTKGSGTFYFNSSGEFTKFSALRYKENKVDSKKYEWILLVDEYKTFEGVKVPAKMTATWKLEERDWTWLKLEVIDIKYN